MSKFLSKRLLKMLTFPLSKRISQLPMELIENICSYIEPFPELVAILYAVSVAIRYRRRHDPSWLDVKSLKPGANLHLTFSNFEGCAYLTNIDANPTLEQSKVLQVQDELLICRDHFAILDIYGSSNQLDNIRTRRQSVFYHTINLRKTGTKELKICVFSDVGTSRLADVPANIYRGFFLELSFLEIGLPTWLNGTHRPLPFEERLIGFRNATARLRRLIDANIMISAVYQVSPLWSKVLRLSVFSVIDKGRSRASGLSSHE